MKLFLCVTFEGLHLWWMHLSPPYTISAILVLFFIPATKLKQVRNNLFKTEHYLAACLRVIKTNGKKEKSFKTHLCFHINLNLFSQALGNAVQLSCFHEQPTNRRCCAFSFSELSQASGDSPIHLHHQSFVFLCLLPKQRKEKKYLLE